MSVDFGCYPGGLVFAGISLPPFSYQSVHVAGYFQVAHLCVNLRTVDVYMAHHLGDALHRSACCQHQGFEGMPFILIR